jgi:lipopolysaccharide transport system ATP-binding protein
MSFNDETVLVKLEHVSKKFRLGQYIGPVAALNKIKEIITRVLKGHSDVHPVVHERYEGDAEQRQIWALRDISLEVKKGERIAILGRNGAGKSTLLKLIVGISTPTEGVITTHCRIVPLMGVGAGFNPELTGRENVYVYGGLLGVPASEIDERYEDIVAFSEIHEFMDTPVKRYSKGMRARLGMAVALNLSPEVLVVDEVLAVGDVAFKGKCMAKMERMCNEGMTLLFVSHSAARVKALCNRAILMKQGRLIADGDVDVILKTYLEDVQIGLNADQKPVDRTTVSSCTSASMDWQRDQCPGDDVVKILSLKVTDADGKPNDNFGVTDPVYLELRYLVLQEGYVLRPRFQIYSVKSQLIFSTIDTQSPWRDTPRSIGEFRSRTCIPANLLGPFIYKVGAGVFSHHPLRKHAISGESISFEVHRVADTVTAQSDYSRPLVGHLQPLLAWQTTSIENYDA